MHEPGVSETGDTVIAYYEGSDRAVGGSSDGERITSGANQRGCRWGFWGIDGVGRRAKVG